MVKAGNEILIAGPRRLYDEAEAILEIDRPDVRKNIQAQAQAWHGAAERHGFAASDGKHARSLAAAKHAGLGRCDRRRRRALRLVWRWHSQVFKVMVQTDRLSLFERE